MSKLYIFAIGGTGSRVLRSLTMLMASGVKVDADEVVPIIIDPDQSNADLTRAVILMNKYRSIRSKLTFSNPKADRFFSVDLGGNRSEYTLNIKNTNNQSFEQFIGLSSLNRTSQAMVRMLFSEENLKSSMDVGFKGNPNIGGVVLNQVANSDDFREFANGFQDGDRIFIISSIFGGTGAAGFPLLLKTLRTDRNIPNFNLINNAPIGAVTVLPYFRVAQDKNSAIDSATFVSKAKSALAYYENNVADNGSINSFYFLGDVNSGVYDNHDGGKDQKNNAHLIEFLAATAIIDFANTGTGNGTVFKEFGITSQGNNTPVTFSSFSSGDKELLYGPLTQFMLMTNCLTTDEYKFFSSNKFNANKKYFADLYETEFMTELRGFCSECKDWLNEMKGNTCSLDLFNTECGKKPLEVVTNVKPAKKIKWRWSIAMQDYGMIADRLNSKAGHTKGGKETRLMQMYYLATKELFEQIFSKA